MTHRTVRKVGDDLERFAFNTAIAALMELVNELYRLRETAVYRGAAWNESIGMLTLLLAPFAPHLAEELWQRTGGEGSVHLQSWPEYDGALTVDETVELVVQVNGKVRDRIVVAADAADEQVRELALAGERVRESMNGKQVVRVVVVPKKLVNIVVR